MSSEWQASSNHPACWCLVVQQQTPSNQPPCVSCPGCCSSFSGWPSELCTVSLHSVNTSPTTYQLVYRTMDRTTMGDGTMNWICKQNCCQWAWAVVSGLELCQWAWAALWRVVAHKQPVCLMARPDKYCLWHFTFDWAFITSIYIYFLTTGVLFSIIKVYGLKKYCHIFMHDTVVSAFNIHAWQV